MYYIPLKALGDHAVSGACVCIDCERDVVEIYMTSYGHSKKALRLVSH
jgi:hypothetical protein